jgi:hypothetical protein
MKKSAILVVVAANAKFLQKSDFSRQRKWREIELEKSDGFSIIIGFGS